MVLQKCCCNYAWDIIITIFIFYYCSFLSIFFITIIFCPQVHGSPSLLNWRFMVNEFDMCQSLVGMHVPAINNYWTRLSNISWFVRGEQINYLHSITEFVFIFWGEAVSHSFFWLQRKIFSQQLPTCLSLLQGNLRPHFFLSDNLWIRLRQPLLFLSIIGGSQWG